MDDAAMSQAEPFPDLVADSMDDLFGEAADGLGVNVALPSAPLPPSLLLRMAELRRTGCCSKLAWSNTGSIARVSRDGGRIAFQTLFRNPKTGQYALSDESKYSIEAPDDKMFVHIQFSGLALDLAAVDRQGGVHMYSLAGNINRMHPAPSEYAEQVAEASGFDQVVGMHWLRLYPTEFAAPYITAATRINGQWAISAKNPLPNAPRVHHPDQRRNAMLYVTCSGRLTLLHQNEIGVWQAVSRKLDVASEDLLSHAAFGDRDDHVILATHDTAKRLRVCKVSINWNHTQPAKGGPNIITVNPALDVSHLTALEHVSAQHSDTAQLSALRVVPPPPAHADSVLHPSTILAIYTHVPSPIDATQASQDAYSFVVRWKVESTVPVLHQGFAKLKQSGPTPVQSPITILRREEDIYSPKLVLSAETQCFATLLCFTASDGTIELRDRTTWNTIESLADTSTASSLAQSGFAHLMGDHHTEVASSPDGSYIAFTKPDGKLDASSMNFNYSWQPLDDGISDTKIFIETAVVCLARQYAILCSSNMANDETLALLPPDLSTEMRTLFVRQIMRVMCRNLDLSMLDQNRQSSTSMRESSNLARPLSAQLILGTKVPSGDRVFAGQFAYIFLNIRQISLALSPLMTIGQSPEKLARMYHEVPSLAGPVKWLLTLMVYILDSLTEVKRTIKTGASAKEAFDEHTSRTGNPAILLMLSSVTRAVLRTVQQQLTPAYFKLAGQLRERGRLLSDRQILTEVCEMARSLPFSLAALVEFFVDFDAAVRTAYTESGVTTERRTGLEMGIITSGTIPAELAPALTALVDKVLPKLIDHEHTDMGKLYFWDTTWLGIQRLPRAGEKKYDAVRKNILTKSMKLRKCRRCGAEMEDIPPENMRALPNWVHSAQRHCYCGGYWWVE